MKQLPITLSVNAEQHHLQLLLTRDVSSSNKFSIRVSRDGSILMKAPANACQQEITTIVDKRADWILKHVKRFQTLRQGTIPLHYKQEEKHHFLGKSYALNIIEARALPASVQLGDASLEVRVKKNTSANVKKAMTAWYRAQATTFIANRLTELLEKTPWADTLPLFKIRLMKARWGSCSPQGALTFNLQLIKAPLACIDYVILHELCHLKEFNHSPRFYQLMTQVMPTWREHRQKLNQLAPLLLDDRTMETCLSRI